MVVAEPVVVEPELEAVAPEESAEAEEPVATSVGILRFVQVRYLDPNIPEEVRHSLM